MMNKVLKKSIAVILIAMLAIALGACGNNKTATEEKATQAQAPQEKVSIRFSYGLPENHYVSAQLQEWANLAMKENSSIEIQMYPSAQLYKDADALEAVQTGAIESAMAYSFNLARIVPETRVFDATYLIDSTDLLAKVIASPIREKIDRELEKKNLKVLAYIPWGVEDFGLVSTKVARVPADTKGLTVRAIGPESAALFKSYGMNPTFLSGSELYMALQRGVIQGTHGTVTTAVERKLYEVAPNITILPFGNVVTTVIMNKEFFNKLPAEQQQALVNAGKEVEAKSVDAAKANLDKIWKRAEELKINVYRPTPDEMKLWTANMDKLYDEVLGKDAPQVLDYIKNIQKMKTN